VPASCWAKMRLASRVVRRQMSGREESVEGTVRRSLDFFLRRSLNSDGERWGSLVVGGRRRMGFCSWGGEVVVGVKVMGEEITLGSEETSFDDAGATLPDRNPRRLLVIFEALLEEHELSSWFHF
jgi:hypothetical protein